MSQTSAITTAGLTKHYPGVTALDHVDLQVPAGTIYGFLGPNGAGKSTAIKILAGLTAPTGGSAAVAGIPLSEGPRYRREVGYLAQEPRFYDWMTGRDTMRFVASLYPEAGRPAADRIDAILARVGLADAAGRRTGTYSGGMRQRLGIAQALVGEPSVLLLDEPVSALDPIGRREVLDLMRELRGEATVFYSTHILEDVERVSDHVAILDGGRLVRAAPTATLLASFDEDRLRVVVAGADDTMTTTLAAIPAVVAVEPVEPESIAQGLRAFHVRARPGATVAVQTAVARLAADRGLVVTENHPVRLGLEDVFLRLVNNQKENAA
jgi:ABC-2 type transport system ATP-binding protein